MGLDLIPTLDPCVVLEQLADLPGVTIKFDSSFVCPFGGVSKVRGILGNSCLCRGKVAAGYLDWLGHEDVSFAMYEDYDCHEAAEFGEALLKIAADLRANYPEHTIHQDDDEEIITIKKTRCRFSRDELNEAFDTIEDAGRWYKAVGEFGSGVTAWA